MANLLLKKTLLKIVDNQLKANNPSCINQIYEKLVNAGYSKSEAKEKISEVVLTDIYDIMKEGQSFDEEKYKSGLEEMLKRSIDYEDDQYIETEWDKWDELAYKGYKFLMQNKIKKGLRFWQAAWDVFCSIIERLPETCTLSGLLDSLDYAYPLEGWLQDYEMELGNAGKYTERIALCQKILELFDWKEEDGSCFQCGIGESLFLAGKVTEAYEYYEKWLAEDPQNVYGINSFSRILFENGDAGKAYEMVRKMTWGVSCYSDNMVLFMRAEELADAVGKENESKWYKEQLDKLQESIKKWEMDDDLFFDDFTGPKRVPVVKDKKIYPNAPCPCGSGRKYKKCCGRQ